MATKKRGQAYPPDEDAEQAANVLDFIDTHGSPKGTKLVSYDGYEVPLPPRVTEVLREALESYSEGLEVIVAPKESSLSTQVAAEMLGISRPTVVRLVESGVLPYSMRGKHRRISLIDILEYRDNMRVDRAKALDQMVRETEETGGYEATIDFPSQTR